MAAGLVGAASLTVSSVAAAPPGTVHYRYDVNRAAPGEIAASQLERGGPLAGYYQPVEIRAPKGVLVSLVVDDRFEPEKPTPLVAGMLIGQVYRFRVTNIPLNEGREVFPTIEVINRLYPPPGKEVQFPIPIELNKEELEFALAGRMVTRVVYLEDPQTAIANRQAPGKEQPYYNVLPNENPLEVADRAGRPMAILRLGSRMPDQHTDMHRFSYGSPPFIQFASPAAQAQSHVAPPAGQPIKQPAASGTDAAPPGAAQGSAAPDGRPAGGAKAKPPTGSGTGIGPRGNVPFAAPPLASGGRS